MDIDDDDELFQNCVWETELYVGPHTDWLAQRGVTYPEELNDPDWNEYWRLYRIELAECLAALHPPRALREGQGMPPARPGRALRRRRRRAPRPRLLRQRAGGGRKTRRKKRRLRRKRKKHTTRRRKTRRRRTRRRRRRRR